MNQPSQEETTEGNSRMHMRWQCQQDAGEPDKMCHVMEVPYRGFTVLRLVNDGIYKA